MIKLDKYANFSPNKKNKILFGRTQMLNKLLSNTSTQTHSMSKDEGTQVPRSRAVKNMMALEAAKNTYAILENHELIQKLQSVSLTNNQKGRIRQLLKDGFVGTPEHKMPEVINRKIEWIINNSQNPALLTDAELRKIKVLHNMLKTWIKKLEARPAIEEDTGKPVKTGKKRKKDGMAGDHVDWSKAIGKRVEAVKEKEKKEELEKREKIFKPKSKRYVVFVGNLPKTVDKLQIMQHFAEFADNIKSIRIPKNKEGESHSFAYVEFEDEPSFEYALSKNHTMMGNRRVNVEYTTHKNSKLSKSESKGKAAKLSALQRSGMLLGSVPLSRKRSARRKKMREARKECSDSALRMKNS